MSSFSTTSSRIPKPSNLKPPSHGHSTLPKFSSTSSVSSTRSSSDSHKENDSPSAFEIERLRQRQQTSSQKLSSTLPPNSIQITHADRFDEQSLIAKINSIASISSSTSFHSGVQRVGSDHSKFDAESVVSVESKSSVNSKSTIGGGSIASGRSTGSRLAASSLASTTRKFDVSKTTSSTQSLPKPPKPTTSSVRSQPLVLPDHPPSKPSSTQSSPSSKSLRSAGSVTNSPNREPATSKFSPAKEKSVSSSISKFSPDRKKVVAQAASSPTLHKSPSNESLTSISERIQEDMMFLDRYFQSQLLSVPFDLTRLETDPVLNHFEKRREIDGMEVDQFMQYIKGEDVLSQMFLDHEKTYGR
jgi:hypothetical protein